MDETVARSIIESLRTGIPPRGYITQFTVGRKSEIDYLKEKLDSGKPGTLLIKANYGSGKSHLLHYLRENALQSGYAISFVSVDSKSGVRFNKMDQILGAIWRKIEVPSENNTIGIQSFFNFVCNAIEHNKSHNQKFWNDLTDKGTWKYSEVLESQAMFIALRAWNTKNSTAQDYIEEWLYTPSAFNSVSQRKILYQSLVSGLRKHFLDPRYDDRFFRTSSGVFDFKNQDYAQCWAMFRDIDTLAKMSGLKGFIVLFDEFEDIISSLNNITYQQDAFWNLIRFSGKQFSGGSFFAVTPEFVEKSKSLLLRKRVFNFDYSSFDTIPSFSMSPLEVQELEELSLKIMRVHGTAFAWNPNSRISNAELKAFIKKSANSAVQDRTRKTITDTVAFLDDRLDQNSESK